MRIVAGEAHPLSKGRMVRPALQGLHEIRVAGRTQLRVGGLQEFGLLGTMRIVTGIAHAVADRRMSMGLDELDPCVRMASIADLVHPVFKYKLKIGSMRTMTGSTHIFHKRHVHFLAFHGRFCLGMALEAEFAIPCYKKFFIFRSVRTVAGETASIPDDGSVVKCHLFLFIGMTFKTDLVPRPGQQGWALRGMRIVAGKAHSALEGRVLNAASFFQACHIMARIAEFRFFLCGFKRLFGCGGIMTGVTHPFGHRVMHA